MRLYQSACQVVSVHRRVLFMTSVRRQVTRSSGSLFALLEGPDVLALSGAAQVYRHHQHNAKIKPYVQNDLEGQGDDGDSL